MKNLFKYVSCAVVTGALCLMLSFDANAQRGAFHGGGGGALTGKSAALAAVMLSAISATLTINGLCIASPLSRNERHTPNELSTL